MKFRKKPVVIDATQYFKGGPPIDGVCYGQCINQERDDARPHIHTLENENGHTVNEGDWIITGVQGERYACKPDIFAATYEAADNISAVAETI